MKKLYVGISILISIIIVSISCKKDTSCEGCTENNKNKPPISNAGPDQVITLPTDSVLLDGRGSSDADGKIVSYGWVKVSGPASLNILRSSDSITKVKTLEKGIYLFELKVIDNGNLSSKDTVQIIVNDFTPSNRAPVANAGADQIITLPTNTINLDGTGSNDPDNNITAYLWSKIAGPASSAIVNANAAQTQVTNLVQGIYQFELKVTDAGGLFSKDTIQSVVNPVPPPLTCNPGNRPLVPAQLIPIGTLSQTRSAFATAAAGDKLVFAGGWIDNGNSSPSSTRVDIYDIVTGAWTIAQLSEGRFASGAAVLENKIFFGGGGRQEDNGWGAWQYAGLGSSAVDIFDVVTNTWSTAQLSIPRVATGASAGNKVVFAGGDDLYGSTRVDIYDGVTNSWTTSSLSEKKHISQIAIYDNKMFLAGGSRGLFGVGGSGISRQIDVFDVSSDAWSTDSLSIERGEMGAIGANGQIFWGGGFVVNTNSTDYDATNTVEMRDLTTNSTSFMCLSEPRWGITAVRKKNTIIFFGGYNNSKFDIFDLNTKSWSIGVLSQNLKWASIISYNDTIYVAGGEINGVLSNQVWKLEF